MSNVIKLRRSVDRVRIEHNLDDVRSLCMANDVDINGRVPSQHGKEDNSYQPLVDEYQRGVETGRQEAETRLLAEFNGQIANEQQRVEQLLASIRNQFLQLHIRWEESVMKLAFSVAQSVLKCEVSIDREIVLAQVRESLRHLIGVEKVKIRVHSRDEEILRQRRTELLASSDSLREMIIEADDNIEAGGCIVESESGNVDARLSTQLASLEAVLFEKNQLGARS